MNRLVAENLLGRTGLKVTSCGDGEEALTSWQAEKPDLILMDLQMPKMDGITAAVEIRKIETAEKLKKTPIIALTAHILEEERIAAVEAGMNGWVSKPVKPAELYRELERLLPPVVSEEIQE